LASLPIDNDGLTICAVAVVNIFEYKNISHVIDKAEIMPKRKNGFGLYARA